MNLYSNEHDIRNSHVNLNQTERAASIGLGMVLGIYGLKHLRSIRGLLGLASGAALIQRGTTGYCRLYDSMGVDSTIEGRTAGRGLMAPRAITLSETREVEKVRNEAFRVSYDFNSFAEALYEWARVERMDNRRCMCIIDMPVGRRLRLDLELGEVVENERTSWHSLESSDLKVRGEARFDDVRSGDATRVSVHISVDAPFGAVGAALGNALKPLMRHMLVETMRRFKQLIETGEIATTKGQSSGRRSMEASQAEQEELIATPTVSMGQMHHAASE